jgi:hypothetical protein
MRDETERERKRAAAILRKHGDEIPAALRAPLMAVRDGTEVPGTLEGVMEFADEWLPQSGKKATEIFDPCAIPENVEIQSDGSRCIVKETEDA